TGDAEHNAPVCGICLAPPTTGCFAGHPPVGARRQLRWSCEGLGHLARAFDEQLGHRTDGPVHQRDDADGRGPIGSTLIDMRFAPRPAAIARFDFRVASGYDFRKSWMPGPKLSRLIASGSER